MWKVEIFMNSDNYGDNLDEDGFPIEDAGKSKSQLKREMLKLQDYGARLVELSAEQIRKIDMPDSLREAVFAARGMKKHGARARQIHHIGALMRNVDAEAIINFLDNTDELRLDEARQFKELELWRDSLLDGVAGVFEEIIESCPHVDRHHLNQLVRNAQKEKAKGKAPKSSRTLFKYLRELKGE